MTVSVAMCTRNGESFIAEQVDSVLNQTRPIDELVVSDDDSDDRTVATIERIVAARAPGLTLSILRNRPALGVVENFQQAIAACSGDLVVLSDQDDRWAPDRVERAAALFERSEDLLLTHSNARLIDDTGRVLPGTLFQSLRVSPWERERVRRGTAIDVLVRRNIVTGATTMFRRTLAAAALPVPEGWLHDEWLGIMAAVHGRIGIVPGTPIDYRQHASNQIGVRDLGLLGRIRKVREPRTERNRNLYLRAQSLVDRLLEMGDAIDTRVYRIAWAKLEHERYRLALPMGRFRRALPVTVIALRGGYRRYGLGMQDAVRDILQPT